MQTEGVADLFPTGYFPRHIDNKSLRPQTERYEATQPSSAASALPTSPAETPRSSFELLLTSAGPTPPPTTTLAGVGSTGGFFGRLKQSVWQYLGGESGIQKLRFGVC